MSIAARLDRLEAIWQREAANDGDAATFVSWWSRPTSFAVMRDFLRDRAHRRFVAEGGDRFA